MARDVVILTIKDKMEVMSSIEEGGHYFDNKEHISIQSVEDVTTYTRFSHLTRATGYYNC